MSERNSVPRGRHAPPLEVRQDRQLQRLSEAAARVFARTGYAEATAEAIAREAGMSKATFYEHFSNKEDCFIAAYDTGVEGMTGVMLDALAEAGEATDPFDRLDRVLAAYLEALASEPHFARASLVESYAAGPRAIARRAELLDGFIAVVTETLGVRSQADRFACEAVVNAISSMVTMRVGSGRIDELPDLRKPIIKLARRVFED
jgi:AcrR family transcriptional regulator